MMSSAGCRIAVALQLSILAVVCVLLMLRVYATCVLNRVVLVSDMHVTAPQHLWQSRHFI